MVPEWYILKSKSGHTDLCLKTTLQSSYSVTRSVKEPGLLGFLGSPFEMHSLNSSNRYALSTHYVPGTILGVGDTKKNQTDKKSSPSWSWQSMKWGRQYVVCQLAMLKGKIKQEADSIWEKVIILCRVVVVIIKGRTFQKGGTAQAKALGNNVPGVLEEHRVGQWHCSRVNKGQERDEVIPVLGIQFL